jgi:hypothetical protein
MFYMTRVQGGVDKSSDYSGPGLIPGGDTISVERVTLFCDSVSGK